MKNNYKNVIVMGELDYVVLTYFDSVKEKATALEYTAKILPMQQNDNGATNINCLHVVNNVLEKILQLKSENNDTLEETCYITIPDKLHKAIQKGTYKNWIKNDGVAISGFAYSEQEIDEWCRFSSLYSKLFLDVNFRHMTYYSMSNPRYNIDNVNRHKYLIQQMRKQIEKHRKSTLDALIAAY